MDWGSVGVWKFAPKLVLATGICMDPGWMTFDRFWMLDRDLLARELLIWLISVLMWLWLIILGL
jgi:hypothetical protein